MTDFFTHLLPLMRDFSQWLGVREVSKESLNRALGMERSCCTIVPGGQAEIFSTRSWGDKVFLYRGHHGFVRMAYNHRARLVPVLSMGEWELLDNVHLPWIQKPARRLLGFPVPFVPYGSHMLPLPRRPPHGITILVGQPIDCIPSADGKVSEADVQRTHARYFDQLASMFERHKASCGYPHMKLIMIDKGVEAPLD